MNLILLDPDEVKQDTATLAGRRADHIRRILKAAPGDVLRIGILNGPIGRGTIIALEKGRVRLRVSDLAPPPPRPPVDLVLALPRPIMLKRVLAQAASMGVGRIFLINARRVEKSFFQAALVRDQTFHPFLRAGLEQAIDTRLPEISLHNRFRPFVEDLLPEILTDCPVRLVAHPAAQHSLSEQAPSPLTGRVLLAIGPEGGWVDFEIEKFQRQNLLPFSLGPRILRVDTAVPALLAQLDLLRGQVITGTASLHDETRLPA